MAHTNRGQDKPAAGRKGESHEDTGAPTRTFGEEGTNKTQPVPDPNARPSDVGSGKFIEPTPFTR